MYGYNIESAGHDNLTQYCHYVESCIKDKTLPLNYDKWMRTIYVPKILNN